MNDIKLPPAPLFGQPLKAAFELQKEQAHHRIIMLMKAKGCTNVEIAEATGLSTGTVGITTRQPWFQKNLLQLLHAKGDQEVEALLQTHAKEAIQVLVNLMNDAESEQVRAKCASDIMKTVIGSKVTIKDNTTDAAQLDEEIARRQNEINELTGSR
jgi:hypothetical protein